MNKIFLVLLGITFFLLNNLFAINENQKTSYINTKNIIYNNNTIELGKDSLISLDNITLLTNKGIIDYSKKKIDIFGNFYFYQDSIILSGNNLTGNLEMSKFKASNINFIYNDDLKIVSEKMNRENNEILFYDNFFTPCEINGYFNCPTWSLKIKKTKYLIQEDKYSHYDSFLQIADRKIFYIPYFTHYGANADRKKGFLTPSFEFELIEGNTNVKTPYYIPINLSSDVTITPKVSLLPANSKTLNDFEVQTIYRNKNQSGNLEIEMNTIKLANKTDTYNSIKINTLQTLNKSTKLSFNSLLTNSISTSRSTNSNQIINEKNSLRIENFNIFKKNDLLVSELNTVTSFDNSDYNLVPYQIPNIYYINKIDFDNGISYYNDFNLSFLNRNDSDYLHANKNLSVSNKSNIFKSYYKNNYLLLNKAFLNNNYKKLDFENNEELNKEYLNTFGGISSEINYFKKIYGTKLKLILNKSFNTSNGYNEDSNSVTFNYHNLFNENRFFGNDISDNSNRLVYGLNLKYDFEDLEYFFNIGQSYDFNKKNQYLERINQYNSFSDFASESVIIYKNLSFNIDSRIEQKNLSKKEMNYSVKIENKQNYIGLQYNETSRDAYNNSDYTKNLKLFFENKVNKNITFSFSSKFDLNNNNTPYENLFKIILNDECSQLELLYRNNRYSDDFNTKPTESIGLTYSMDYLGFFNYESSTNLLN